MVTSDYVCKLQILLFERWKNVKPDAGSMIICMELPASQNLAIYLLLKHYEH